ncbi:MAG TPA: response regulator [Thermoanaerobaculia bacterium]|nr:response regulator [Thermoanaerobaculia bacterium]
MSALPRLLIVDDDPAIRDILCAVLRRDGWDPDSVADGEAAMQRLRTDRYDLVVLDLVMPRYSGEDVIRFIKEHSIDTRVIVVSAVSGERSHDLDPQIVTLTLQKPIELNDLRMVIRAVRETGSQAAAARGRAG